jgi:cation:H+ antiporter
MMALWVLFCFFGFLMLHYGAEWLVKGSSSLARSLGVSPIVIGLTVVAFGTSAPELVVSLIASIQGKSMIAVGNVVGSNICNIALVLGLAAVFQPITSDKSVVKRDIPIMIGISLSLLVVSFDSEIGRLEGASLFGGIILYTFFNYFVAMKESKEASDGGFSAAAAVSDEIGDITPMPKQIILISVGMIGVAAGAQIVVECAVKIMEALGVSEKFIGLTIVAFGTSLPELATSVVAALRKEMDISIGNLVGSNVFNILCVLGAASLVISIPIDRGFLESGLVIDYLVMMFVCVLTWLMMRKSYTVSRQGGVILLFCYVGFVTYQIVSA